MNSVFAKYQSKMWPFRFAGSLHVAEIVGGIPTDPRKAEGFIRSKIEASDDAIKRLIAETMAERGVGADQAADEVARNRHLNGFRRDDRGLYLPGANLKACLKEAASVAANSGKLTTKNWGKPDNANYRKGLKGWFPEHVFVEDDRLYLGVTEPTRINQRFVHAQGRSGITYEEIVEDAKIDFTVETDYDFAASEWAAIWTAAERLGLGATRSLGFGRFVVTRWDKLTD